VGYWQDLDDLRANWAAAENWTPSMDPAQRGRLLTGWRKAVDRSFDWIDT
jgi:glycerol kinase